MRSIAFCTALAFLLAGCGGMLKTGEKDADEDTGSDVAVDEGTDAPGDPTPDAYPDPEADVADAPSDPVEEEPGRPCDHDLGTFSPGETWAGVYLPRADYWLVAGSIGAWFEPPPISEVDIESWVGYGGPDAPGTYTVDAWEAYDTCTLCLWVHEDCSDYWTGCAHTYMAESATLVIDTIDMSRDGPISGSLSGVYFIEVAADGMSVVEGGMSYCLDLWEFSGTFERMN